MRAGLSLAVFASRSRLILSLMMGEKKPDREGAPCPCRLPAGGREPPCWSLPDLIGKHLIENVSSPMNRQIFRPGIDFVPETREAAAKEKGAPGRPFATRSGRSGLAAGKAHGRRTGAVVGLDVDKADHALLDLLPGALQ